MLHGVSEVQLMAGLMMQARVPSRTAPRITVPGSMVSVESLMT
jgi:hypothetical protein